MNDDKPTKSHKLLYSEIKERLKDQFDSIDSLDTKAGVTLGFSGAILVGLINSTWFLELPKIFSFTILSPLIFAFIFLVITIFVRSYHKDPDPTHLITGYGDKSEDETIRQLIRNFETCFNQNIQPLKDKTRYLNIGFVAISISVTMICVFQLTLNNRTSKQNRCNNHQIEETSCYVRHR